MSEHHESFRAINSLLEEARTRLGADGHFRIRVLLEMLTLELAREIAKDDRRGGLGVASNN